jgi:hypothetical protein
MAGSKLDGKTDTWWSTNDDDDGCRARDTNCLRRGGITRRCGWSPSVRGDAGVAYEAEPCCNRPNRGSAVNRTSPENAGEDLRRTTAVNAGRRQQGENHKGKRSTGSPGGLERAQR